MINDKVYLKLGSNVNNGYFDVMLKAENKKEEDLKLGEIRVGSLEQEVRQMYQDHLASKK